MFKFSVLAFDEAKILHTIKHYLPSQAPLKDFIHHNTLHAFQELTFHAALHQASRIFGYKVYLSLNDYRQLFLKKKIRNETLDRIILAKYGEEQLELWRHRLLHETYDESLTQRIGSLRSNWKYKFNFNLEKEVHPPLFRLISAYLDQGIATWKFPAGERGLLSAVRGLERYSFKSLFRSKRVRDLLLHTHCRIHDLLAILVGDEKLFETYLFDQQFSHPGWSGMVAVLEDNPDFLTHKRKVSLHDFIVIELLLEIDALDHKFRGNWRPLNSRLENLPEDIFREVAPDELFNVYALWQDAMEWTYYDEVLNGLSQQSEITKKEVAGFQSVFCIDDRSSSLRTYIERLDARAETFGTAGYFNVDVYFQPEHGRILTKTCPASIHPRHLIRESEAKRRHERDANFGKLTHGFFGGWLLSHTMGLLSSIKLMGSIFIPRETSFTVSSFKHMDKDGKLSFESSSTSTTSHGLQIGFTVLEMTDRIEGLLKSIGLTKNFADLVYFVGHGASSVNNTHYAGYDCGACSGRAGSVNARVAAHMANHKEVKKLLLERGIEIPENVQFIGALHDTTRDEIQFYDLQRLTPKNLLKHIEIKKIFYQALELNARERARRFLLLDKKQSLQSIYTQVRKRAVSLFEPRPEWNHATNAACIVGRRELSKYLFLDRRSFLNSYDFRDDPDGKQLLNILQAVTPVCGGINLEYYFSRVDNARLGAGTKLPHNVVGLIGVANGTDGDLRPGLPGQMVNIHDPLRLLMVIEHHHGVVHALINRHQKLLEWFMNKWIHLVVMEPGTKTFYRYADNDFVRYHPVHFEINRIENIDNIISSSSENLPVYTLSH